MKLSIVVPIWNRWDLVQPCLESVRRGLREFDVQSEVILVDDCSTDGSAQQVAQYFPEFRLLRNHRNLGFARAANRGMAEARGELLLLLGSDTELESGTLPELFALLDEHPQRELVAPRLVNRDGSTQRSCMDRPELSTVFFFGTPMERWLPDSAEMERYFLRDFDHLSPREDVQPPATCWLVRRSTWERVGAFDEELELFFNDVDWAQRHFAAGGKMHFRPEVRVLHVGGGSTAGREDFVERWQTDRLRYYRKHFDWIGSLLVKACVSWTFADWWLRQPGGGDDEREASEVAAVRRSFKRFLWEE